MNTWKQLASAMITAIIGLFLFSSAAQAMGLSGVQILLQDPNGDPIEGVATTLVDSDGMYVDYTPSNTSGYVNFYTLTEDEEYTIQIRPGESYDCSTCGILSNKDVTFTASTSHANYNSSDGMIKLNAIQLEQAARFVTVTVTTADLTSVDAALSAGDPVAGSYVSAFNTTGDGWSWGATDENGVYQFAVEESDTSDWSVYVSAGETVKHSEVYEDSFTPKATGETALDLEVVVADSTINYALKTQSGGDFEISDYASVSCFDTETYTYYFWDDISEGESSGSVSVIGSAAGTEYECSVWTESAGSSSGVVTVTTGETEELTIVMLERNASLAGEVRASASASIAAEDGGLVDDVTVYIWGYASENSDGEPLEDSVWAETSTGEFEISLVEGGVYDIGYYFWDESGETSYIQSWDTVQVVAGTDTTVDLTIQIADAQLTGTVTDADGNPVNAWLGAYEEIAVEDFENSWGAGSEGMADNGEYTMNVVGGKTYNVFVYAMDSAGALFPDTTVEVAEGETVEVNIQAVNADFTLGLEVAAENEDGTVASLEDIFCYAFSPATGYETYADNIVDGSGEISLISGEDWYIGCMGYSADNFYDGEAKYSAAELSAVNDTLALTIIEGGNYYDTQTSSGDCSSALEFTLPDNESSVSFSAGAIAASGTCTVQFGTAFDYTKNEDNYPLFDVFDINAKDGDGNEVSSLQTGATVILKLKYDPADLPEGMTIQDIVAGYYNEDTGSWESETVEVDEENQFVTITANHLSVYSALGDRGLDGTASIVSKPLKPKKINVKKRKRKSLKYNVVLKNASDRPTKLQRQIRWKKNGKKGKYTKWKRKKKKAISSTSSKTRWTFTEKKLRKGTKYQIRSRFCNSAGCGKWKVKTVATKGVHVK